MGGWCEWWMSVLGNGIVGDGWWVLGDWLVGVGLWVVVDALSHSRFAVVSAARVSLSFGEIQSKTRRLAFVWTLIYEAEDP